MTHKGGWLPITKEVEGGLGQEGLSMATMKGSGGWLRTRRGTVNSYYERKWRAAEDKKRGWLSMATMKGSAGG